MIQRRSAKEISDALLAQLSATLGVVFPSFIRSFERVLTKAIAGESVLMYEHAMWVFKQIFVKTADNKEATVHNKTVNPLQEHGALVGRQQFLGTRSEMTIEISVITTGGSLQSGERVVDSNRQVIYTIIGDVALDAETVEATIRATVVGDIGNVDPGGTLYFESAPDDVEKEVVVKTLDISGSNAETTEEYRRAILERWLARPQGGAYADYKLWAETVDGVKRAYPYSGWGIAAEPDSRAGQVFVYIESVADVDGIPTSALLDDVSEYIEGVPSGISTRRNINAYVKVLAITRKTLNVTLRGLVTENNLDAAAAIESAIGSYFSGREPGGQVGYTIRPPRTDVASKAELAGIAARVAAGYSGVVGEVILLDGSTEIQAYWFQEGEKGKVGTITWE